jgi:hypothetical protein
LDELDVVTDSPWKIVKKDLNSEKEFSWSKKSNIVGFVVAKGTTPVTKLKRKCEESNATPKLKQQRVREDVEDKPPTPLGFVWDNINYSCAYDSVLTILLSIWKQNPSRWKKNFEQGNEHFG